jgi:hypothetical protein
MLVICGIGFWCLARSDVTLLRNDETEMFQIETQGSNHDFFSAKD